MIMGERVKPWRFLGIETFLVQGLNGWRQIGKAFQFAHLPEIWLIDAQNRHIFERRYLTNNHYLGIHVQYLIVAGAGLR